VLPNVYIITLKEDSARSKKLSGFLNSEGIKHTIFRGLDAVGWGLRTTNHYKFARPGNDNHLRPEQIGCYLSHYWLWRYFTMSNDFMLHGGNSQFTVLEDDCKFVPDWKENMSLATQHLPSDWDVLLIGSCCTEDKPKLQIGSNLYECKYPFCTHGYVVRGKALQTMIDMSENMWAPIDILLAVEIFPKLKVFTILPRICDQDGMDLPI